ncbi:hypothetical protein AZF37_07470 [endosymbiont 'TC1' of Trimyema compressum]|uniref:transglycosylase domain-containing protein n=1 Tax=endosymbiont 'TC1' of Trimyema compressum TaxID=243899 RepID=UPI0007F0DA13|nr:PBP1A family penicillin-binding protein [endosymbiont 'TC1' of Trimyema compressum]AMP21019.1 hypothetical protein AZF37_07470 [endosymbiont 'TC1' of Trimyema compressum]
MSRIDNKHNKRRSEKTGTTKKKSSWKNITLRILITLLVLTILAVTAGTVYLAYLSKTLPEWNEAVFDKSITSQILDKNEQVISKKFAQENKTPVTYNQISPMFVKSVIATEDNEFYEHNGFSIKGILRSAVSNIFSGSKGQGGSTLTQQLARGVFLSSDEALSKDYSRKIKEILLAMQIEERLTKEEIFTHYANTAYFGHGAYGIEAASTTYFNKHANELTDAEATLLAGLPQSPSFYDPYVNMNEALKRRAMVVKRLVETNRITEAEGEAIKNTEVALTDGTDYSSDDATTKNNKYFTDYITIQADRILSEKKLESLYKGGYTIYTTMDTNVQQSIENVYQNSSYFPSGMNGVKPESAMVVVDHTTGEIRGLVGGRTYELEQGFNRAIDAKRQPGSTFKPISVYGPAFEAGIVAPSSVYNDSPEPPVYDGQGRPYELVNYEGTYSGKVSIRNAIARSTNTIAVRVLNDIGTKTGFDFVKRLGITSLEDSEKDNLSLALGGLKQGVSPLEMAKAYSTFANKGKLIENTSIRKIVDSYGKVVYEAKPKSQQVISQEVAYMVTNTLEDVVDHGSGTSAALANRDAAGKTGSTDMVDSSGKVIHNGNKDLWFVGYTPELTAAVWIGYDQSDENHYLSRSYSSNMCANIWSSVMSQSLANTPNSTFEKPKNIIEENIDRTNGLPTNTNTGYTDIFIKGLEPKKASSSLVDSTAGKGSATMKNG